MSMRLEDHPLVSGVNHCQHVMLSRRGIMAHDIPESK